MHLLDLPSELVVAIVSLLGDAISIECIELSCKSLCRASSARRALTLTFRDGLDRHPPRAELVAKYLMRYKLMTLTVRGANVANGYWVKVFRRLRSVGCPLALSDRLEFTSTLLDAQFEEIHIMVEQGLASLVLSNVQGVTDMFVPRCLVNAAGCGVGASTLRELRLDGSRVTDRCLGALRHLGVIEILDLSVTRVSERGIGELFGSPSAANSWSHLYELYLRGCSKLRMLPPTLCTPRLRVLALGDAGYHADGTFYHVATHLKAEALSALASSTMLRAAPYLDDPPKPVGAGLTCLDLAGCKGLSAESLAAGLGVCCQLVRLSLAGCQRASDGCLAALAASGCGGSLTHLNLSYTAVSDLIFIGLGSPSIRSSLRTLLLAGCSRLTGDALVRLTDGGASPGPCPHLHTCSVHTSAVDDQSAPALAVLPALRWVDFGRTRVSSAMVAALAALPSGQLRGVGLGDARVSERLAGKLQSLSQRGCVLSFHSPLSLIAVAHTRGAREGEPSHEWAAVTGTKRDARTARTAEVAISAASRNPSAARVVRHLETLRHGSMNGSCEDGGGGS